MVRRRLMALLLDTNAFLFAGRSPDRLSQRAREAIERPIEPRLLSAVAIWECATKASTGKLRFEPDVAAWVGQQVERLKLMVLPVEIGHCYRYSGLPVLPDHRDPFDRMLVAQALAEGMTIVSSDRALDAYGVRRIW